MHDPALHTTFNPPFSTMANMKASTTSLNCSSFKSGESFCLSRFGWYLSMTLGDDPCDGEWSRCWWKLSMTLGDNPCDGEWWTRMIWWRVRRRGELNVIDSIRLSIEMNHTSNQTKQIEIELRTLLTLLCFFERVFFGGGASLFFFLGLARLLDGDILCGSAWPARRILSVLLKWKRGSRRRVISPSQFEVLEIRNFFFVWNFRNFVWNIFFGNPVTGSPHFFSRWVSESLQWIRFQVN